MGSILIFVVGVIAGAFLGEAHRTSVRQAVSKAWHALPWTPEPSPQRRSSDLAKDRMSGGLREDRMDRKQEQDRRDPERDNERGY